MSGETAKLTVYLGERERSGGSFTADALVDLYARRQVPISVMLRGIAGFGPRQHMRTTRVLTLSEDLPLVSVAIDRRDRVEALVPDVRALGRHGLVTVERALARGGELHAETKLTIYLGRHTRPTYVDVVAALRRHGVSGATVLLGVDGTLNGERRRARLIGRNAGVPLMVVAVGDSGAVGGALAELGDDPVIVERVSVLKRDGRRLADPPQAPAAGFRRKLTIYLSEQARHDGAPLYLELVRRLREAGGPGATALRGVWGYHGNDEPHGDRVFGLARRVPVVVIAIDTAEAGAMAFEETIDPLTAHAGLVTSEWIPTAVSANLNP